MKLCLIHAFSLVGIGIVVITQRNKSLNCTIISLQLLLVQPYRQNDKRNVTLAHSFYDGKSNDNVKTVKKNQDCIVCNCKHSKSSARVRRMCCKW
jgi:hypothetical protein